MPQAITLRTDDGLRLAADYYGSGRTGGPGVVLLHMIPPHFTYKSYPPEFIQALVGAGFSVVNVNRRGAPGSEGVAEAAYKGPNGWLDAKAGRDYLVRSAPCRVTPEAIVLIGASNGTTTAFDYLWEAAAQPEELAPPEAIVLLSAGPYSENQHPLRALLPRLATVPIWAAYPEREEEWNRAARRQAAQAGVSWRTRLFTPGTHGTKLFGSNPELTAEVVEFLRTTVIERSGG
jgi:pimeloyl-ACP methyl ester carboxylesterase